MKQFRMFAILLTLVALTLTTAAAGAQGRAEVVAIWGEIPGQDLLVHAVIEIPAGADRAATVGAALAAQGARPATRAAFSLTGLVWPQFGNADPDDDEVAMNYNPADDRLAGESVNGLASLTTAAAAWNGVSTSSFVFDTSGTTTVCPSLVRECPGRQTTDGTNDFAWMSIKGRNTLGVTWYNTSVPETDMALNLNFTWASDGVADFDAQTVIQHELGHVLGLGHSTVSGSLMEAVYDGVRRALTTDDIAGITALYPSGPVTPPTVGSLSGVVTATVGGTAIAGATVSTSTGDSTTTGASGDYAFSGVPTGDVTVTVSASGYSGESQVVSVTDGGTHIANFALDAVAVGSMVSVTDISYSTSGGKDGTKNLRVTIQLRNDQGAPVADASVSIELYRDGSIDGSGTGTTGADGSLTFQRRNAPSGFYTTVVTDVSAAGLTWDAATPPNGVDK